MICQHPQLTKMKHEWDRKSDAIKCIESQIYCCFMRKGEKESAKALVSVFDIHVSVATVSHVHEDRKFSWGLAESLEKCETFPRLFLK